MKGKKTATIVALLFIVITATSAWFFGQVNYQEPIIEGDEVVQADGKLHVLIIGEDAGLVAPGQRAPGRSDTLMVASYDPEAGTLSLLSIPRDTLVEIPGRKNKDKINHALAFGGIDLTMRTVSKFLNIPLRYYVHVQTDGFKRLVDAIGGVPIYVDESLRYTDRAGGLYINIKQGDQVLNGEQAEGYVRYRLDSDLKRIERQQKFVTAAVKQVLKPANILRINQLLKIAFDSIKTNIPITVGLRYLAIMDSIRNDNVTSHTIDGDDSVWIDGINYFVPDRQKLDELIETYFYSNVDRNRNQQTAVKVLIGNGDIASGEQVVQLLRQHGFRVLGVELAEQDDLLVSQVSGHDKDAALAVAEALVLHEVFVDSTVAADVDVIVTLGRDLLP